MIHDSKVYMEETDETITNKSENEHSNCHIEMNKCNKNEGHGKKSNNPKHEMKKTMKI